MIPTTATKIQWLKMMNLKSCGVNCMCADRMRRLLLKIPLNVIDEAFTTLQIKEQKEEFKKCYSNKMKNDFI